MKLIKICQECGLEFEAVNQQQKFCKRKHFRKCVICGKDFEVTSYHLTAKDAKTTCSRKCSIELRKRTNLEKYGGVSPMSSKEVRDKVEETTLERYGVRHAAQSDVIKAKTEQTNLERYGTAWYTQSTEGRQAIKDSWQDKDVREQRVTHKEQTNLERYGDVCVLSNLDIRQKARDTYEAKTGYSEPLANPEVQAKIESTNLERLGVKRPLQNDAIKNKWIETNNELYGCDNPMQNVNVLQKAQLTCLQKYGNVCFLQSNMGKELTTIAMNARYGVDYFSQSAAWKLNRMTDPSKLDNLLKFDQDPATYINTYFDHKPTLRELCTSIGTYDDAVTLRLNRDNLKDKVAYVYSYMESEVYNMVKSIDSNIVVERNTHKIITPYELDLYLPEYKISIECNPTSTHNSTINVFDSDADPTPTDYHLMKTKLCEEQDIFLLHIFGSEWTYGRDKIKSLLRNLLNKPKLVIDAKDCAICELASFECNEFLNNNHRLGHVDSDIQIGLYNNDELVFVMAFKDVDGDYEILRYGSLLDTKVVDGFAKVLEYFIQTYKPNRIFTYSDRAHDNNMNYINCKFIKCAELDPKWVWVDSRTDISYYADVASKSNIAEFLHDDTIDLSKTEKQIMEEHGFLQVFDSGTILWEWCAD